jgi:hypothetical protein
MNGLFNMNFMMTFLLAKDLPETKNKLLMAMSAGQSANLMAPVLLKVGAIDTITELTQENTNLKAQVAALQAALQECEDKTNLEKIKADLAKCTEDFNTCNQKLLACDKIVDNCDGIKRIMIQVKDKSAEDLQKAENKKTLQDIITLAGKIIPPVG